MVLPYRVRPVQSGNTTASFLPKSSLNTFFSFDDVLLWDGGYFNEMDEVHSSWSCCVEFNELAAHRRRVRPPLPDDAMVIDFFTSSFKPLFLLLGGKSEVPPLRVDLGIKDLLEVLVDLVEDAPVLVVRRVIRSPPPISDAVAVDFFFSLSFNNTLFFLWLDKAGVLNVEANKDFLEGLDMKDGATFAMFDIDVLDFAIAVVLVLHLRDFDIVWWCLLFFVVVLVSRGVSSWGVSYFEDVGAPISTIPLFDIGLDFVVLLAVVVLDRRVDIDCWSASLLDVFD